MGSGGPPFDDLRDNQLNELQSDPSQSILAKVTYPTVQDRDLDSISGSESCLSIDSVHVSNNNNNNEVNNGSIDSVAPKTNVQNASDSVAPKTNVELQNFRDSVQNVSDSVAPKTNVEVQIVRDSAAPKTAGRDESHSVNPKTVRIVQNVLSKAIESDSEPKTKDLACGNAVVGDNSGEVAELCMGTCSEDESVDSPAEGPRWRTVLSRKFRRGKEPAPKPTTRSLVVVCAKKLRLTLSLVLGASIRRIWKAPKPGLLHSSVFHSSPSYPFSRYCFVLDYG